MTLPGVVDKEQSYEEDPEQPHDFVNLSNTFKGIEEDSTKTFGTSSDSGDLTLA